MSDPLARVLDDEPRDAPERVNEDEPRGALERVPDEEPRGNETRAERPDESPTEDLGPEGGALLARVEVSTRVSRPAELSLLPRTAGASWDDRVLPGADEEPDRPDGAVLTRVGA